jgi:serine acetyltransferase
MRANIIAPTDIEIGKNSIVGAMALVNKSVPDGKTVVGVPCRILEK